MKRFLFIFLALVMLSTIVPISTHASENTSERVDILNKASAVFPEYASKITLDAKPDSTKCSAEQRELVISETRKVSPKEYMVFTEYSDGLWLLDEITVNKEITYNSTNEIGTEIQIDITVKATCSGANSYFMAQNVKYTIDKYGFDHIDSIGSPYVHLHYYTYNDYCTYYGYTLNSNETYSKKASVVYSLAFKYTPNSSISTQLWVEVGSNSLSVHHDIT